ncbi:isoprenylcysteine carboxylmethyltransferase family protein [Pseudoalteromonas piscicida]|uniref:methyltransferase family protein n=1 Tax=Pseudoalteromonas piscicida TaxID=43662 RepID=UPI0030B70AAD
MKYLELKVPPVVQVLFVGLAMFIASSYLPTWNINYLAQVALAGALFSVGIYFCVAGVYEFRKRKTTVDPRYPDKASDLVDSGVYQLSRNPMYVGFALFLLAIVIYLGSPILLVGVFAFILYMNRFQIEPEEVLLQQIFGERYKQYTKSVRRWL